MVSLSLGLTISISRRPSSKSTTSHDHCDSQNPQPQNAPNSPTQLPPDSSPRQDTHSRTPSICPSNAATCKSLPPYNSHPTSRPESLEYLLSRGRGSGSEGRKRVSVIQLENGRLRRRVLEMDRQEKEQEHGRPPAERKKSYGIGGAGNIRRPSDVIYPVRTNADGTRRRSSVWSSITMPVGRSPESGKKGGVWGMFRRGSVGEEVKVVKDGGESESGRE